MRRSLCTFVLVASFATSAHAQDRPTIEATEHEGVIVRGLPALSANGRLVAVQALSISTAADWFPERSSIVVFDWRSGRKLHAIPLEPHGRPSASAMIEGRRLLRRWRFSSLARVDPSSTSSASELPSGARLLLMDPQASRCFRTGLHLPAFERVVFAAPAEGFALIRDRHQEINGCVLPRLATQTFVYHLVSGPPAP